jgi:hypothetical protein
MIEHYLKYTFSFYSKDKNIVKVNDSSSYMLLDLNKKLFVNYYDLKKKVYFIIYNVFKFTSNEIWNI